MKKKNIAYHIRKVTSYRELTPLEERILHDLEEPWYRSILY